MNTVTNVTLNLATPAYATAYAVQGDTLTRQIAATLVNGNTAWTPPTGATCVIRYRKPDGTIGFYDTTENGASAYSISGNIVTFTLAAQALTVPGTVYLQLDFYAQNNQHLSTFTLSLEVSEAVVADGQIASEDYINALTASASQIAHDLSIMYGAPRVAATAAAMTNTSYVYVYTGTTGGGFTNGHWYAWNGSAWADGGLYNSTAFTTDTTLTVSGAAADAKTVGEMLALAKYSDQSVSETMYGEQYGIATPTGTPTIIHGGINTDGSILSPSNNWGTRSARTAELAIPPGGIRIHMDATNERWVYSIYCYSSTTFSAASMVYSPTNKKLVEAGTSTVVLPKDGAKYLRIQIRCLNDDPANAAYGGARPLVFDGESGAEVGDDTKIKQLLKYYIASPMAPIEKTDNLISTQLVDDLVARGFTNVGGVLSGTSSMVKSSVQFVRYTQHLPAGKYIFSFDYNTSTMSSGNLNAVVRNSNGEAVQTMAPNRSAQWRHYSNTLDLASDGCALLFSSTESSANSTISVRNIQLVEGDAATNYLPPITAVDSIARSSLDITDGYSDNSFDLRAAYAASTGVTLASGVLCGTNADLSSVILASRADLAGKSVDIAFEAMRDNGSGAGKLGIEFLDADGNRTMLVELTDAKQGMFAPKYIYRIIPTGTVVIRFTTYNGTASEKTYSLRNIRVRISNEARTSTGSYDTVPTRKTAVDVVQRNLAYKPAEIHDGSLFRLTYTPEGIHRISYAELISLWDSFMADYPDQVTKEQIGESTPPSSDPTEVYPIYKYVITPVARERWLENGTRSSFNFGYDRTVMLTSGCHGLEWEGFWGLYRLMRVIYEEGYKYPTLRNLRSHVRFVVIPSWSPYAVEHNQRYMANVNSSPYHFFSADPRPGEAQAIVDTLDYYGDSLSLWMDFHTNPYAGSDHPRPSSGKDQYPLGCYAFVPDNTDLANALYALTCDFHNLFREEYDFDTKQIFHLNSPGANGHPTYGNSRLPTVVLEICTNMIGFPEPQGSGGMMKIATEWYGNCVAEAIRATAHDRKRYGGEDSSEVPE